MRSILWSPIKIGEMELQNRLVVPPIVPNYSLENGYPSERTMAYYDEKAKGGWGLIILEATFVDKGGMSFNTLGLFEDAQIEPMSKLAKSIQKYGTKVIPQLLHAGRQSTSEILGGIKPIAPSPIPCPLDDEVPHEMTIEEIKKIVKAYGNAAYRAKMAGFDGVEIYSAHGYLIAQFLSHYSNKRVDKYGGCLENRLRFLLEIITEVKARCGNDFPLTARLSGEEFVEGGRGIEETKAIAIALERAGVNMIGVSAGVYSGPGWNSWTKVVTPMNGKPGLLLDFAEALKTVVSIPVMVANRLNEPRIAEAAIISGKADLIGMARGSLADPNLPNKVREGKLDEIRLCIGCNQGCEQRLFEFKPIQCMVNPTLGYEYLKEEKEAEVKKKIHVVGSGPAGLAAAISAAKVGHIVTVYEERATLGGQFALAAIPPEKGLMTCLPSWQAQEAKKLGIKILTDTAYTKDTYLQEKPDTVILATGSHTLVPPIPGIHGDNVITASDILSGKRRAGENILIAGGGLIGSETATHLAMQRGRKIMIVDMLPDIAPEEEPVRRIYLMRFIKEKEIGCMTSTKIVEIKENAVILSNAEKGEFEYPCDTVVLALGVKSNNDLYFELKDSVNVILVGDARKAGMALDATREGFLAGLNA